MTLKTKLVLWITSLVLAAVVALSGVYLGRLLRQHIEQSYAATDEVAHQVLYVTRSAVEARVASAAHSAGASGNTGSDDLRTAVTSSLRRDQGLQTQLSSIMRYSPTVFDVSVTDWQGRAVASTNPGDIDAVLPPRSDYGEVRDGSLLQEIEVVFGPPRVYNVSLPLERDGQPFLTVNVGVRTTFLRNAFEPSLYNALTFVLLAVPVTLLLSAVLARLVVEPFPITEEEEPAPAAAGQNVESRLALPQGNAGMLPSPDGLQPVVLVRTVPASPLPPALPAAASVAPVSVAPVSTGAVLKAASAWPLHIFSGKSDSAAIEPPEPALITAATPPVDSIAEIPRAAAEPTTEAVIATPAQPETVLEPVPEAALASVAIPEPVVQTVPPAQAAPVTPPAPSEPAIADVPAVLEPAEAISEPVAATTPVPAPVEISSVPQTPDAISEPLAPPVAATVAAPKPAAPTPPTIVRAPIAIFAPQRVPAPATDAVTPSEPAIAAIPVKTVTVATPTADPAPLVAPIASPPASPAPQPAAAIPPPPAEPPVAAQPAAASGLPPVWQPPLVARTEMPPPPLQQPGSGLARPMANNLRNTVYANRRGQRLRDLDEVFSIIRSASSFSPARRSADASGDMPIQPRDAELRTPPPGRSDLRSDESERGLILRTLASTNYNRIRTAELLGISLAALQTKLKEYEAGGSGIER